jgi:vancomycin aglycone glucosyltransferase
VRVLFSTYDSRGGVEPLVALAVRLRELGAEARVCALPDCAQRLAEVGVPMVPVGAAGARSVAEKLGTGSTSGGALLVTATRFVTPVRTPCCAQWLPATSDRS